MTKPIGNKGSKTCRRGALSHAAKAAAVLLCGVALGWLMLMAVYALPLEPIKENLAESLAVFNNEGGTAEDMGERVVKGYVNTWQDNRTDVMMLVFASHESDEPLYRQAAISMGYEAMDGDLVEGMREYLDNGTENLRQTTYGRYWHGYLVLLKPLLMWCNYMDIRMINMLAEGALLAALCWLMQRRGLGRYLPALLGGLVLLTPWIIPLSMQYMTCFYPMALGMLLMLWKPEFIEKRLGDWLLFMLLGMVTAYVDVLTYPLVTFGMPFILWTIIRDEEGTGAPLKAFVRLGLCWLVGYAGMWSGKWALVALFGTEADVASIFSSIDARTSAEEISRWSAVMRNLMVFWRKPYKLMGLCYAAGFVALGLRVYGRRKPMPLSLGLTWVLCALLPLGWYYVMADHSHTHYFYTHRILAVSAFALLCLVTRLLKTKDGMQHPASKAL